MCYDVTKMKKRIIRLICMAQVASDSGKSIYELPKFEGFDYPVNKGYKAKDKLIIEAIKLCKSCPKCGIRYGYSIQPDQNGNESVLVYFRIKREGNTALQVSFHTFSKVLKAEARKASQGMQMHWANKQLGCRAACEILIKEFDL